MMDQIQSVSFIGSGNVATHLALALKKAGLHINEIYSQSHENAMALAQKTGGKAIRTIEELDPLVDLYVISIPDGAIKHVMQNFPQVQGIVVHTSGITPVNVLEILPHYGVFYPLQTFSKKSKLDMCSVPFCIEASSKEVLLKLKKVASMLSPSVFEISSDQRQYLHLTAVMVNNYSNYLFRMAFDILETKGIDHTLLMPLIEETISKIKSLHPEVAQTGPARRKDTETIEKHLQLLEEHQDYKELYKIFAQQLTKKYNEQL